MKNKNSQTQTAPAPPSRSAALASGPLLAGAQLEARDLLPPLPARRGISPLARDRASLLGKRAMYLPV